MSLQQKRNEEIILFDPPSGVQIDFGDGEHQVTVKEYWQMVYMLFYSPLMPPARKFIKRIYEKRYLSKRENQVLQSAIKFYDVENVGKNDI